MKKEKLVFFHVDMDSPLKLLNFWGMADADYGTEGLDRFYSTAMSRALELFRRHDIAATFFCVGDELDHSLEARRLVREAFDSGHEIANHTYSHPFELTRLDDENVLSELSRCSKAVERVTGSRPAGFRSPGYNMDDRIMGLLPKAGIEYDSSAFWSALNPFMSIYHRRFRRAGTGSGVMGKASFSIPGEPYYPSNENWQKRAPYGRIVELPLPHTRILQLPFYSNFHIMVPSIYRNIAIDLMNVPRLVYLFHLIEFVDFNDGIPKELRCHTNMNKRAKEKIGINEGIIKRLIKRYKNIRTDEFVNEFRLCGSFSKIDKMEISTCV